MATTVFTYKSSGPVTSRFLDSHTFVRGIMGPIGSGKSTACVVDVLQKSHEQPLYNGKRRSRWAVIRNTYPELKTTTIKTWHQWVPPQVGKWQGEGPPTHHIQEGELDMEVIFVALDRPEDVRKLLSMELTGAWVNEAREIPKAVIDGLTGRVGRYPPRRDGGCSWCGIIMDTNPPDQDHWWYKLAEEVKPDGYEFFRQPSGLASDAENIQNLPQGYYERTLAGKDKEWIKVYVHGDYGFVMDGKPVYPEYRDGVHCQDFNLMPNAPLYVGIDFGLTPAATIAQRGPMGQWYVHSELCTENMGAVRFSELLHAHLDTHYKGYVFQNITGDPAGDNRAQTDESTPFLILRSRGINAHPASTNDPQIRREAVATCLTRMIDGYPALLIHPQCRTLRKGMAGAYCYKRLQVVGTERYRDVPDKNIYSHVCESLQYLMLGAGEGKNVIKPVFHVNRPRFADGEYNELNGVL